jgi:hypothetical protein
MSCTPNALKQKEDGMFDNLIDKTDNRKLVALEKVIDEGLRTFTDVGSALLQIRDGGLYQPQYSSFELYCRERWDLEHSRVYQLMDSAQVVQNLKTSTSGGSLPTSERQARPLALLPLEQQAEAWNKAVESAPNGKSPTGELVKKIVDRYRTKAGKEKRRIKVGEGWTPEELKEDTELFEAFKSTGMTRPN